MKNMPTDSLQDLLERIRDYCAAVAPGSVPLRLRIDFSDGQKIMHPIPPGSAGQQSRKLPPARHGADFRSIHWFGSDYSFSPTQAACVRVLWEAWEDGIPDVGQAAILEAAGSETERLRSLFVGHPAWGVLIVVGGGKGTYRLAQP
jgi:hypothetical protein